MQYNLRALFSKLGDCTRVRVLGGTIEERAALPLWQRQPPTPARSCPRSSVKFGISHTLSTKCEVKQKVRRGLKSMFVGMSRAHRRVRASIRQSSESLSTSASVNAHEQCSHHLLCSTVQYRNRSEYRCDDTCSSSEAHRTLPWTCHHCQQEGATTCNVYSTPMWRQVHMVDSSQPMPHILRTVLQYRALDMTATVTQWRPYRSGNLRSPCSPESRAPSAMPTTSVKPAAKPNPAPRTKNGSEFTRTPDHYGSIAAEFIPNYVEESRMIMSRI